MLNLGPVKWMGGILMASISGGVIVTKNMEAVWDAPEAVRAAAFHRDVDADSDVGNDE